MRHINDTLSFAEKCAHCGELFDYVTFGDEKKFDLDRPDVR